jgi:hypothetical protein
MDWELLWKVTLVAAIAAFAVLSLLVTILGAGDIRRLIRALRDAKRKK